MSGQIFDKVQNIVEEQSNEPTTRKILFQDLDYSEVDAVQYVEEGEEEYNDESLLLIICIPQNY